MELPCVIEAAVPGFMGEFTMVRIDLAVEAAVLGLIAVFVFRFVIELDPRVRPIYFFPEIADESKVLLL